MITIKWNRYHGGRILGGTHFDGDAESTAKPLCSFAGIILQMAIAVRISSFHICTLQLVRAIRT